MKSRSVISGLEGWLVRTVTSGLALGICLRASAQPGLSNAIPQTLEAIVRTTNVVAAPVQPVAGPPALDGKRLFALGMIETGNDDNEVGAAGEVSRYQIHPLVWKAYSHRMDYRNTALAMAVAQRHWTWLAEYFQEKAGRQPNDFDMYVMWNTKYGYYARRGFSPARLAVKVRDRAERFVNLVNRKS